MMTVITPDYANERKAVERYMNRFCNTYGVQFPNIVHDYGALLWLAKTYQVKSLCEIGTWEGYASLFLWLNANIERQKAIDICANFDGGGSAYHHDLSKYGRFFVDITPVVLEKADTTVYQPKPEDSYDMVFVDGNHSYVFVKNDTKLAARMATRLIAFHDYHNGNVGVDQFFAEFSPRCTVQNIAGSAVAFLELTPENRQAITLL